jgi:hypothetical protein
MSVGTTRNRQTKISNMSIQDFHTILAVIPIASGLKTGVTLLDMELSPSLMGDDTSAARLSRVFTRYRIRGGRLRFIGMLPSTSTGGLVVGWNAKATTKVDSDDSSVVSQLSSWQRSTEMKVWETSVLDIPESPWYWTAQGSAQASEPLVSSHGKVAVAVLGALGGFTGQTELVVEVDLNIEFADLGVAPRNAAPVTTILEMQLPPGSGNFELVDNGHIDSQYWTWVDGFPETEAFMTELKAKMKRRDSGDQKAIYIMLSESDSPTGGVVRGLPLLGLNPTDGNLIYLAINASGSNAGEIFYYQNLNDCLEDAASPHATLNAPFSLINGPLRLLEVPIDGVLPPPGN